jgi:hypothetical protein
MNVAKADAEIIARRLEIPSAQLFVDRHHGKIAFRQRFGNVHHKLGRAASDKIKPVRKLATRFKPGSFSDRWRNRIAVENRKNDNDQLVENLPALHPGLRTQHPFDHFTDHRKAQRKGLPASVLDGLRKSLFGEQNLGVVTCTGARVFVDALLHDEGRLCIDEVRKLRPIANRRTGTKQLLEQLHRGLIRLGAGCFVSLPYPGPDKFSVLNAASLAVAAISILNASPVFAIATINTPESIMRT